VGLVLDDSCAVCRLAREETPPTLSGSRVGVTAPIRILNFNKK